MTRREFLELLQALNAVGLVKKVGPALEWLWLSQTIQIAPQQPTPPSLPPPPPPPPLSQMTAATQALNDHVSQMIQQTLSIGSQIATHPVVVSGGGQADISYGPMSYSVSGGVTTSYDRGTGNATAGLYLSVTKAINTEPSFGISTGVTIGVGIGDPHGFYGESNVIGANGPVGGVSFNSNQSYTGVNGTLGVGIGTPNVSVSTESYTYGGDSMSEGNLPSAISAAEQSLWSMSQDPMNPQELPKGFAF